MIGYYIFFAFVVALIADVITNNLNLKPQSILHLLLQPGLVYLTGLLLGLIYLIDIWKGEYCWVAFIVVFILLITIDIILHKRLIKKVIHSIGCFIIMGIILYIILFTRYQLKTDFDYFCWSPNGKQIAFFMEKALYRYGPSMFSFSSPDDIWKKYYLCTMDNNGEIFKIVKETDSRGIIIWPSDEMIVYNQKIMIDKLHYTKFKGICNKIKPDGTGLEELWHWDEKSECQEVHWVTPSEKYLVLYNGMISSKKGNGFTISIYDMVKKEMIKELSIPIYKDPGLHGSYKDNKIAMNYDRHLAIIDLDTLATKEIDWIERDEFYKLLAGYEWGRISPDRTMTDDDVFKHYNEKNVITWTKRSYLFNIFGK